MFDFLDQSNNWHKYSPLKKALIYFLFAPFIIIGIIFAIPVVLGLISGLLFGWY